MWNSKSVFILGVDIMETLNLLLFGFIVYSALVVVPSLMDDFVAHPHH